MDEAESEFVFVSSAAPGTELASSSTSATTTFTTAINHGGLAAAGTEQLFGRVARWKERLRTHDLS